MTDISLALYRKYRPETFEDVCNQDHIVNVLAGSLEKGMIPHALLFTGSRGTGKTSVARIFARAVGAHDVDTYEIDAASNRGIDDIRELKESVHTLPYESPYKVYIIDEVHMLTKEAFNALLKTLEEPPSHVIFILATTEKDKLLDTITSRCQVFEFRAPTRAELREVILSVAKKEKFSLDSSAADVIALAADGSYRDALGITQKVMMASTDTSLTTDEVSQVVGAPKNILLQEVLTAFATKDVEKGLQALAKAHEAHADMKLFYTLLLERFRSIIILRHNPGSLKTCTEQYGVEDMAFISEYAADSVTSINSHLMIKALDMGDYINRCSVPELPLELLLVEHCKELV
ncbi:MAG: DNA polymerase III subunit gamma/tau [Candidatus Pacebacteria bacterium]|nr:DNA polymerase III subunit gamma/tau [Candidatus Paceibacterota bacterium]MCF7857256.1 DNA polymerase III subunit gamma/tau [Candidatus Paceibacterota bacterium]